MKRRRSPHRRFRRSRRRPGSRRLPHEDARHLHPFHRRLSDGAQHRGRCGMARVWRGGERGGEEECGGVQVWGGVQALQVAKVRFSPSSLFVESR
jgi:hypothetical protein